jgi:hypothetical protein
MQRKYIYPVLGLFVGAIVNIIFNLIAAAIQQRAIGEKFNDQTILWMMAFAVVGLLIGYWLSLKTGNPDASVYRSGIKAKGVRSRKGQFVADERTGQGIDAEDIRVRGDISLTSSISHFNQPTTTKSGSSEAGAIDAKALSAGGNIAIFNGSVPLGEQLEYFRNHLNISSPQLNDYATAKFRSYWDVWRTLQLLRLAGNDLWEQATNENVLTFSNQLRATLDKVEESAIFFDEADYRKLKNILEIFGAFRLGKIRLLEIRSERDLRLVFTDIAEKQIDYNRQYKDEYEELLNEIRISFRERICR